MRSGQVSDCYAETVFEKDVFEETLGLNRSIIHRKPPFGADRGKAIGYYAVIKLTNGGKLYKSMSKQEVETHALKYSKQKSGNSLINIWKSEFDKMAQKTVLRQLVKFSPLSSDLKKELEQDNAIREVISDDMALEDDYRQTGQKVRDTFEESYSPSPNIATLDHYLTDDDGEPIEQENVKQENKEEQNALTCIECDNVITPSVHTYSVNKYSKPLCIKCQKVASNG
jgi:recombinational DNA repair protein RecT